MLALERQGGAGGDLLPKIFQRPGIVVHLHVRHGHAEQLLLGVPQRLARPAVDVHEAALEVVHEHRVGGLLDEAPEPDLAPGKRLLGPRPLPANLRLLELPLDGRAEAGHVLLGEVVVGAGLHDPDGGVLSDLAGYHYERRVVPEPPQQAQRVRRPEPRHVLVGDDYLVRLPLASASTSAHSMPSGV